MGFGETPEHRAAREAHPDLFPHQTVGLFGVWLLATIAASLTYQDGRWLLPLNFDGEPCPFPLDPLLLPVGAPLGQYHCPYCGDMILAGLPHGDWRNIDMSDVGLDAQPPGSP
jgi:hypothetical protein